MMQKEISDHYLTKENLNIIEDKLKNDLDLTELRF